MACAGRWKRYREFHDLWRHVGDRYVVLGCADGGPRDAVERGLHGDICKQVAEAAQRRQADRDRQIEEQRRKREEYERAEQLRRENRLRELEAELSEPDLGNESDHADATLRNQIDDSSFLNSNE